MADNAPVIPLNQGRTLALDSGRTLKVTERADQDLLEITEASGQVSLRIQLTAAGPVIVAEGARLALKATESIELKAETVSISAGTDLNIDAGGRVAIDSKQETRIHCEEDIRVTGAVIHLN